MRIYVTTSLFSLIFTAVSAIELPEYTEEHTDIPKTTHGSIHRYDIHSSILDDNITVDVWIPAAYDKETDKTYPVVYAHDGQNLFDPDFSFAGVAWELDLAVSNLSDNDGISETPIIVGINNRGAKQLRANDYFPEKAVQYIKEEDRDKTWIFNTCATGFYGDKEAGFVVEELKPLIDHIYRTNPTCAHTFAIGSSMGALAALYLMCEYPEVFGGVACMSTHWIGSLNLNSDYTLNDDPVCAAAILEYLDECIPLSSSHYLYLDQGTLGWDAKYLIYEKSARQVALNHGYSIEQGTLATYDAEGAGHNEWFWQQRVEHPLSFLLNKHIGSSNTILPACDRIYEDMDNPYIDIYGRPHAASSIISLPPGLYVRSGEKILIR